MKTLSIIEVILLVGWSEAFVVRTSHTHHHAQQQFRRDDVLRSSTTPSGGNIALSVLLPNTQNNQRLQTSMILKASSGENGNEGTTSDDAEAKRKKDVKPDILDPFPPAADPMYSCRGPVGEKKFVLSRTGGPTDEELSNDNMLRIVRSECSDLEVNTLVWKCLGYRFDEASEAWKNDEVFPNWKTKYPTPPDFIGMQRIYTKEIDQVSLRANQGLVRSVPLESKQSLKTHLKPLGFRGYQYKELTPNKTRRAQCANWLIFYREELYGYTVEELKERRRLKKEAEERNKSPDDNEWKPPLKEVF